MKLAVIGVGGVSCGGKTTLAKQLVSKLQTLPSIHRVSALHQDDFYKDEKKLFEENVFFDEEMKYHNWELPECFEKEKFGREFLRLKAIGRAGSGVGVGAGDHVESASYSCSSAADSSSSSFHVIILEGILIFDDPILTSEMTKRYFLDLPKELCFERRMKRTYIPPEPEGYFDKYYWPSYLRIKENIANRVEAGTIEVSYLDSENESIEDLVARLTHEITGVFGS